MSNPGPCIGCGATNYELSCGGPTICPRCDCGTDERDAPRRLRELREELARLRESVRIWMEIDSEHNNKHVENEADNARLRAAVEARDASNPGTQVSFGAVRQCPYCGRGASAGSIPHKPDCPILTHPLDPATTAKERP